MKKQSNTLFLAQSAMIAAIYVVLTVILAPFSYGEVQVRVSEALTILPVFTPASPICSATGTNSWPHCHRSFPIS